MANRAYHIPGGPRVVETGTRGYQIPGGPRIAESVSAGGDVSISAGVGALTITGHAPTVTTTGAQTVAPGVGSLLIAGHAPTVIVALTVAPDAGALAITGYAPTANVTHSADPGVGALTITGHAPTVSITAGQTIFPDLGALTLTGQQPTVTTTQHVTAEPSAGAFTITGYAPTVFETAASPTVAIPAAELLLTTYAPIVVNSGDRRATGAGRPSKKRRRIELDGRLYEVDERDVPALLEAVIRDSKPPGTAAVVEPAKPSPRSPKRAAAEPVQQMPEPMSVDLVVERFAMLQQDLARQAEQDVLRMLDRVAQRVLAEVEDEDEALVALLLA